MSEFHLHLAVARALPVVAPSLLWSHFPAGEARTEKTGRKLKDMGLKKGWPDFILCLPGGRLGAIELKAPGCYLKPEQKAFRDDLERSGGAFALCRSLDEVLDALRAWGVPVRSRSPE